VSVSVLRCLVRRRAPGLISQTKNVAGWLCSVVHGSYVKLISDVKWPMAGKLFVGKRGEHDKGEATESVTMTNIYMNRGH
jgi:hypothetical protein